MNGQPNPARSARERIVRRRLRKDRLARWVVFGGGAAVVASILGIFFFIFAEVLPLMRPSRVAVEPRLDEGAPWGAPVVASDPYRSFLVRFSADGSLTAEPLAESAGTAGSAPSPSPGRRFDLRRALPGSEAFVAAVDDGSVALLAFRWNESFDPATGRKLAFVPESPALRWGPGTDIAGGDAVDALPKPRDVTPSVGDDLATRIPVATCVAGAWFPEDGIATLAARFADDSLRVARRTVEINEFSGRVDETWEEDRIDSAPAVEHLVLDSTGETVIGVERDGTVHTWSFADGELEAVDDFDTGGEVSAAGLLLGDRSLLLGRPDGRIEVWFRVRDDAGVRRFRKIRSFDALDAAVVDLTPNARNKGFLALGADGGVAIVHSTSHRVLWSGRSDLDDPTSAVYTPKGDGAWIAGPDGLQALAIENPHPEAGLRAFFGKVWYEDYDRPQHTWQSSSGSDDFEPKFGLMPLIFGTFKGTIFSLLLAAPLGILGAMFASQFMHRRLLRFVKPAIELMAAIPSVILGFLAALWLAPRMERFLPGMVAMVVLLPALVLAAHVFYERIPARIRNSWRPGTEVGFYMVACIVSIWGSLALSGWFEATLLGGDVRAWIESVLGVGYEQRNAVVVGIAMGFAVVPIIFTVAEDAFSNVPKTLVSGSLALGATPWQTVTQIVLPTASPGIFSAVMIGLGRAIGETMIVLMATGNTPIMDWNPFNGFRTLSANIAVEIPEAPVGGTLYRTLFLAALLLFLMTFAINTLAEVVRHRLRRKYAEL